MLEPVGTAPGLVVPPAEAGTADVVVLPGPPRELQAMWRARRRDRGVPSRGRGRDELPPARCCGCSASPSPRSPRRCARPRRGLDLDELEITTCLRRGEVEVVTRYEPEPQADVRRVRRRGPPSATPTRCSPTTARRSTSRSRRCCVERGWTIATAESCTGGLLAGRLTDRAGSSAYVLGGRRGLLQRGEDGAGRGRPGADRGARAPCPTEVAEALADGARARFGADVGVGITGVAGPGGGHRGQAGRQRLLLGRRTRRRAAHRGRSRCPAPAPTCATARPRSRCTSCGGCSSASA